MERNRVTRDQLTNRLTELQDSLPGVRAARRAQGAVSFAIAVLALVAVLLLGRRATGRGSSR
jgi:hypothetical protein